MIDIMDEAGNQWPNSEARIKRLDVGVNGAQTCIPFQCKTYWMRNLEGRDTEEGEKTYEMCIKQTDLDVIAGKASPLQEVNTTIVT